MLVRTLTVSWITDAVKDDLGNCDEILSQSSNQIRDNRTTQETFYRFNTFTEVTFSMQGV